MGPNSVDPRPSSRTAVTLLTKATNEAVATTTSGEKEVVLGQHAGKQVRLKPASQRVALRRKESLSETGAVKKTVEIVDTQIEVKPKIIPKLLHATPNAHSPAVYPRSSPAFPRPSTFSPPIVGLNAENAVSKLNRGTFEKLAGTLPTVGSAGISPTQVIRAGHVVLQGKAAGKAAAARGIN